MTRFLKGLLAVAMMAAIGIHANAAVISVQPTIAGYFDTSFTPIPAPAARAIGTDNTGFPTVVQVDLYLSVDALAPGEDSFGTAAFSVQALGNPGYPGAAEPNVDAGGYAPYAYPNVDTNGAPPPGANTPLFAQNADLGTSNIDMQGILVQMGTGAFTNASDPRRNVGESNGATLPSGDSLAGPMLLGSAYLTWNGIGQVHITLAPLEVSAKLTTGLFVPNAPVPPAVLTIGNDVIPEPSSLVLLGSCLVGVVLRRRA